MDDEENKSGQDLINNVDKKLKNLNNAKKNISKNAAQKAKLTAAAGPVIFWGTIIIVAIIILVGIIMFFVSMPGLMMDKLKLIGQSLIKGFLSFFGTDDSEFVAEEKIYQTLDYLEDMGYGLKEFGFLTDYVKNEEEGVKKENDKITEAHSDFIKRYLISDNYTYIIKNKNLSTNLFDATWQHIRNLFGGSYNQDSTRGLLAIYKETSLGRADENNLFADLNAMDVDVEKKTLYLKKGGNKVGYSLDGWTGRYAMPLEFLLSVHAATMMPDLAYDMADTFDTNINIYIREVEASNSDDDEFIAYLPYIATVTDHWYRDVYYVVDLNSKNEDGKDTSVVAYNYDYEKIYRERWTLYETYSDIDKNEDSEYKEYATQNYNELKLYVLSSEGEYATSENLPDTAYTSDGRLKSNIVQDKKYPEYYIYLDSIGNAKDENITVAKKAVALSTAEDLEDVGWNDLGNGLWSAYIDTQNLRSSSEKENSKKYSADIFGSITQTGEGQRGETNPKIKKMFLQNTYFRYTSSVRTAEIITALREKIKNEMRKDNIYGALENIENLDIENYSKTAKELGLDADKYTCDYDEDEVFELKDYVGQVSINQDSLNAFSMLENIHTLDADYIYRDFKELVVELGYFSKEDLTEGISKDLAWIIPDVSSLKTYPERNLDKSEIEYGTLIHSRGDVLAEKYMILDTDGYKENRNSLTKPSLNPKTLFSKWWNYMYGTVLTEGITAEDFVNEAQRMWDYMSETGYTYVDSHSGLSNTFEESKHSIRIDDKHPVDTAHNISRATLVSWALINLNTEFENYCSSICEDLVMLDSYKKNEDGSFVTDSDGKRIHNSRSKSIHRTDDVAEVCVDRLCGELITDFNDLQAGDIIAFVEKGADNVTGLDILGEKKNGSFVRFTGEKSINKGDMPPEDFNENEFYNSEKYDGCFGIRLFGKKEFNGYKGNEMVTSPVTGILLEYGTYEKEKDSITGEEYRVNTDLKYTSTFDELYNKDAETSVVSDKVGYAKILVLDKENYLQIEQSTSNRWNINEGGNSLLENNGAFREELIDDGSNNPLNKIRGGSRWSDFDQTIYAYKEFAETYETTGIAGDIIVIDGFVCEEPDENVSDVTKQLPSGEKITIDTYKKVSEKTLENKDISAIQEMQLPNEYRDYELYITQSEKANNKIEAETRCKMRAFSSLYIDDVAGDSDSLIVIKEGTILGRTMTDKELLESEKFRNGSMGTYEENREYQAWQKVDGKDKIIGNYLRLIMRDQDGTPVENIENYFKDSVEKEMDWEQLWFYTPMSSGPTYEYFCGPESIGTNYPGQISVGLVQETDKQYPYWNSIPGSAIGKFLYKCWLMDNDLCAKLEKYKEYDGRDFWGFAESGAGSFGPHMGEFYHLQTGTVYVPIANYTSGTPCLYNGGSVTGIISRDARIKWQGEIYESFNEFLEKKKGSLVGAAGDNNAERTTIYVLDADGNVKKSGLLVFAVDGASLAEGADVWYPGVASGSVYTDATGYMLAEDFDPVDGIPQRVADHSIYLGDGEDVASKNLRASDLQKDLSYISNIDREKFIRIQREVAKETYLDEIIEVLPWIKYRSPALQSAVITILVSGSEAYKGWPEEYQYASDEFLLQQVAEDKSKVKSMGTNPDDFTPDPTTGHAWTVPEIARKIINGAVKKYDLEDYVKYGMTNVLTAVGVDYRAEGGGSSGSSGSSTDNLRNSGGTVDGDRFLTTKGENRKETIQLK